MEAFVQDAQNIVKAITDLLPFPVSLTDGNGKIIADSKYRRVGAFHRPSKDIILKNDFVIYEEKDILNEKNVLPGVAVPLEFNNQTKVVLGIIGTPKEVMPYAKLIKKHIELMWKEVVIKQVDELEENILESFINYLLLSKFADPIRVKQYCQRLYINERTKYYCIIIDLTGCQMSCCSKQNYTFGSLRRILLTTARDMFIKSSNDQCTYLNDKKLIILKAVLKSEDEYQTMEHFRHESAAFLKVCNRLDNLQPLIVSGTICDSLLQVNTSYHKAEHLLSFVKKHKLRSQIFDFYSWSTLLAMFPERIDSTFAAMLKKRLGKLIMNESYEELRRNFIIYCDCNMNITHAAKQLFIHRNTLIYRLHKIEKLARLNTRNFQHCLLLYTALKKFSAYEEGNAFPDKSGI